MDKLIEELKNDHLMIFRLLSGLGGLADNPGSVRKLLLSARKRIMEHFRKEDKKLYPALRKASGRNKRLKEKLDKLADEMSSTTEELDKFFKKYSKSGPRGNFIGELNAIYRLVKERLQKEELYIFTEYTEYKGISKSQAESSHLPSSTLL